MKDRRPSLWLERPIRRVRSVPARPRLPLLAVPALVLWIAAHAAPSRAENIDPDADDSQVVWAENLGWINAEPLGDGGPGVQVDDFELTGWMWGENVGWISLSCKNTSSCDATSYGVLNDGGGVLSGFGWSENVGWISFAPVGAGVTIDPTSG